MNIDILNAQLDLYKKGREQALAAFEKIKADVNSFNGAIEACDNLIRIEDELTNQKPQPEAEKEAKAT